MSIITQKFAHDFLQSMQISNVESKPNADLNKQSYDNKKSNVVVLNDSFEIKAKKNDVKIWHLVRNKLNKFYGESVFNSWLKLVKFKEVKDSTVFFAVPTSFIKEWVLTHYSINMLSFWKSEDSNICDIEIYVDKDVKSVDELNANNDEIKENNNDLYPELDLKYTFDNFIVGRPNELAFAAAKKVAEASSPVYGSNPLFLYAGVGLGKTHLMHAIAWHIKKHSSGRKVIYLSAEKFMYKYITALKNKDIMSFKNQFRSVDILMVDDVQFISGKDSTQEEFFHTFNTLIDRNKQLVISADRSPNDLQGVGDRIKSRLSWGLVADINNTTFELRVGILQSKVEQMKISVPSKVVEFMAQKIISNVRELEGALNKVIAHSCLVNKEITIDFTKETLADLLRANSQITTLDDILEKVASHFNLKISDLRSDRRSKIIVYARQMAMYLSKILTQHSLPDIGKKFGGKDHSTVIHSIKKMEALIKNDRQVVEEINILTKMLK